MGLKTSMSRALSFAHLEARGRAQDDDDKPDDKDKDENARRSQSAQRAQDDGDDRKDDDNGDDRDAQDEDNKPDDDDDSGKGKRGKNARRARAQGDDEEAGDDEDDDDSEMRGSSAAAAARRREQARCAAIFHTRAAGRNPALAAQLAFTTRLPRHEAIALLEAAPAPTAYAGDRAARNPRVGPGMSPEVTSRQAIATSWDRAFSQVTPQTGARRSR